MKILQIHAYQYSIKYKKELTIKDRVFSKRDGLIIELIFDRQKVYTEASPLYGFSKENHTFVKDQLEKIKNDLLSIDFSKDNLFYQLNKFDLCPSLLFALQIAFLQLFYPEIKSKEKDIISLFWGNTNQILKAHIKVKIPKNTSVMEDVLFIKEILKKTKSKSLVRIDANQKWSFDEGIFFCNSFKKDDFYYIEEPLQKSSDLQTFSKKTKTQLAIDESIYENIDFFKIESLKALVIKPSIYGCIDKLKSLKEKCDQNNIELVLSSSLESSIGISNIIFLSNFLSINNPLGIDTLKLMQDSILIKNGLNYKVLERCI
jgi:o-succinylbenzoate synthase